jgi:hypothetical protein
MTEKNSEEMANDKNAQNNDRNRRKSANDKILASEEHRQWKSIHLTGICSVRASHGLQ